MTQNNERGALIADAEESGAKEVSYTGDYESDWTFTIQELEKFAKLQALRLSKPTSQNEQQEAVAFMDEDGEIYALPEQKLLSISIDDLIKSIGKNGVRLYTSPPKQAIPEGLITNALVEALNCDCQSTLDSEQVKIFNTGVATLYEIIKESQSKSLTSETNTEVGE